MTDGFDGSCPCWRRLLLATLSVVALALGGCGGGGSQLDAAAGRDGGFAPGPGVRDGCVPACADAACGPDGCGGSCGTCAAGATCDGTGRCVPGSPPPSCGDIPLAGCCDDGPPVSASICVDGAVQTREGGRCAWHAGHRRYEIVQWYGDAIPSTSAYDDLRWSVQPYYLEDPSGAHPRACPGSTCRPTCQYAGYTDWERGAYPASCGPDGCGGSCGTCPEGFKCDRYGKCIHIIGPSDWISEEACAWGYGPWGAADNCCAGDAVLFCDDDAEELELGGMRVVVAVGCGAFGLGCGWGQNASGAAYLCGGSGADPSGTHPRVCPAIDANEGACGGLTYEGCCGADGVSGARCQNGELLSGPCEAGVPCGWDPRYQIYACGGHGADPSGRFPYFCP